jgi:anti-sigma B factor antagonist
MAEKKPTMSVSTIEGVIVVELSEQRILDEVHIARIGSEIEQLISEADSPKMVIDFVNVSNMSSSALGMLITVHKRVREASGQLRLCNIQDTIQEVFRITRLNEIFNICSSRADAINSIN